jgi:benzylsuccinate CoA-transferase BbsE subunit
MAGPLAGLRVIELAHERTAFAGKLLADAGADVIVVEPPGGAAQRMHEPFVDDVPDPRRSLSWWHYNTSKRGVTLDLDTARGRELLQSLVRETDVVLEGEDPGHLAARGLDYASLAPLRDGLLMVSITPFGQAAPRHDEPATDLTLNASGGMAWMCGYDDHSLPPVRGGGNQSFHTGAHYALMALLVALLHREHAGEGQHIDVNIHACCNVTTELGSYGYLVSGEMAQRQTGRHASPQPSSPSQIRSADGHHVSTGLPPRNPEDFRGLRDWIHELGLEQEFPEVFLLEMAMERKLIDLSKIGVDEEITAIYAAGRDALMLIASRLPSYDFFIGAQERGISVGVIYAPEEVMADPHFIERGFPVELEHPELDRSITYPGAPYRFSATPWEITRRAPQLGEHNAEVLGAIGVDAGELESLRASGVI